jgi:upstream activation factor subunit UAF30
MALSDALSEFLGGKNMIPRTEVVKDLHAYIKEHNLQNPANRRQIIFDDKLQSVFKVKTTDYFKINKLISKHVKPADEVV